jgi:hypothetical protein
MAKGWGKSPLAAFIAIEEFVGPRRASTAGRAATRSGGRGTTRGSRSRPCPRIRPTTPTPRSSRCCRPTTTRREVARHRQRPHAPLPRRSAGTPGARHRGGGQPRGPAPDVRRPRRDAPLDPAQRRREARRHAPPERGEDGRPDARDDERARLLGREVGRRAVGPRAGRHALRPPARQEPDPSWPDERLEEALRSRLRRRPLDRPRSARLEEIRDPATSWDDALRFYFNIRTAGSGRAVDPRRWDDLAKPRDVPAGRPRIGLGFDGSISQRRDGPARLHADGYSFISALAAGPTGRGLEGRPRPTSTRRSPGVRLLRRRADALRPAQVVDRDRGLAAGLRRGRVDAARHQPGPPFAPAVDRWLTGHPRGHPPPRRRRAHRRARQGRASPEGPPRRRGGRRPHPYVLIKGDDRGRIDGAVADVLAYEAAMTMPEAAAHERGTCRVGVIDRVSQRGLAPQRAADTSITVSDWAG